MKNIITIILFALLIHLSSCKKFLEAKPDQKLVIPSTLKDLQAVNDAGTNNLYPAGMDNASNDYYLTQSSYNSVSDVDARNMYTYQPDAASDFDWQYQYNMIFSANVVLDAVDGIPLDGLTEVDRGQIKGAAFFKRAHALFNLLVEYALPYETSSLALPGVPIRLNSSINETIKRSSIKDGFEQVENDLKSSISLLPQIALVLTRPSKVAAYGLLSRVYLYENKYQPSLENAKEALSLYSELIDYNSLSVSAANPFDRFNKETLFYGISSGRGGMLSPSKALVDPQLYSLYSVDDLRKVLFYKSVSGGFAFKGDYSGQSFGQLFHGLATDELYLTKAECEVRLNDSTDAKQTMRQLLDKRFKPGKYVDPAAGISEDELLKFILLERRKELAFRGMIRWMDFKRLKNDPQNRFEMERILGAVSYHINPEDLKTAFLIPQNVISISGIEQNKR